MPIELRGVSVVMLVGLGMIEEWQLCIVRYFKSLITKVLELQGYGILID